MKVAPRYIGVALIMAVAATTAQACPVCFGDRDSQLTQSAAAGVLFMVVLTYTLLVVGFGGVLTFFVIRARRLQRQSSSIPSPAHVALNESTVEPSDS